MGKIKKDNIDNNLLLQHMLEELKMHNDYANKLDINYTTFAGISFTLLTVLAAFATKQTGAISAAMLYFIPLCALLVLGVFGYYSRITAILRGHMARLEDDMNKLLGNNPIHGWNSYLVEEYMAKRNITGKFLSVPIMILVLAIIVSCCTLSYQKTAISELFGASICVDRIIWWIYLLVISVIMIAICIPFLCHETVRKKTYYTEKISTMYKYTITNRKDKYKKKLEKDLARDKNRRKLLNKLRQFINKKKAQP